MSEAELERFRYYIEQARLPIGAGRKVRHVYQDYRRRAEKARKIRPSGEMDIEWLNNAIIMDAIKKKTRR